MEKILVVLSGGMDSATALAWCVDKYKRENITTITFNYGSKHNQMENERAALLSDYYGVKNIYIEMPFINKIFKSDLLQSGGDIPEGHYADPSMKRTVVPFRNGIMLSIAAGLAESLEYNYLCIGNHEGDHAIYPDCRTEFMQPMDQAIENGTYKKIKILRPFEKIDKTEIIKIGSKLEVPYEISYSCYKGKELHCGKCGTCFERKEAFALSGTPDPTQYAE